MNGANDDVHAGGRSAIARHFRDRIPALLQAWVASVAADPVMSAGDSLPRSQLEDHLPQWLEAFADVLEAPFASAESAAAREAEDADAHGLQRWQQGYDLHEVTREWGCLHRCLVLELEAYVAAHPDTRLADLTEARLKLAEQVSEATSRSAEKYFRLERKEAAGNVRDLEQAVEAVRAVEAARAELWQQAAHDLRGNLGVVSHATDGLHLSDIPAERRQSVLAILRNNVASLRSLLDDVTNLARLQAGQEQRLVSRFDAAAMLQSLCDDLRPLAEAKGLELRVQGVPALLVDGDPVKVRRIAQNLLLNAIKYTRHGDVSVSWSGATPTDPDRWVLSVADSGPGLHAGPGAPLAMALSEATEQSHASEPASGEPAAEAAAPDLRAVHQTPGEGLGLSIVKRLCELLDATIELVTAPEQGSTFRILLPRRYASARG